ncbi:MAG: hypothetical protein J5939_01690 [Bacteroidales bacterium]|nr:hypothetical protein [Bacteroidales bacterium]
MKRIRPILLALALCLSAILAGGCGVSKLKDLSVSSVGVKYIVPTSSRSLDAVLLLGLDNPSISFTVKNTEGTVKYYDREMIRFTTGELPVQERSEQVYELPCTAVLSDKVSFLDLLAMAAKRSMDGMTVDIKLHVKLKSGVGTTLSFDGIDLAQFTQ